MEQKNMTETPKATKIPKLLSIHGDTRTDNYFWLNDRDNPAVTAYLEAENEYLKTMMAHTIPLQMELFDEMVSRVVQEDVSVPYTDNGYLYYTRYVKGGEYPVYCRKKDAGAAEEILLDGNEMAKGHSYFDIGGFSMSPDNTILAYSTDTISRRQYSIHFKNLATGIVSHECIKNTDGEIVWANDNKTIFYTVKDPETLRSYQVKRYQLGQSTNSDSVVFTETDETFGVSVYKTKSDRFIVIHSYSTLSTEARYIDAVKPQSEFKVFEPRRKDLEYSIEDAGDGFYVLTNLDARNFRVMKTGYEKTESASWLEVLPHRNNVFIENIEVFKDYLVVTERFDGLNHLRVINRASLKGFYVSVIEEAYDAYTGDNELFDTHILRFAYSSLATPTSVIDVDMNTGQQTLLKEQEVPGNFDKNNYITRRIYATASDGKKIPMSLVFRKGLTLNGSNPTLLYGYGSYGYTIDPVFSQSRLSLLDRGFVFAIAHIRGGQIYGREWYEDGKLLNKKNTFTDFIACAEYLIETGYTSPDHLFAMGGSAGGLLMGAVVNMRPELFKAVIAAVPFVDVVTTMLDESIPLTTGEYDEWGNPNDKVFYEYMLSYSPYDNVANKDYPAMLVTTGLHDSQVQYWEPAKWVAKLRDYKTDKNLLLLYTNMDTGHGGASGRFERFREIAMDYAFLIDQNNK
ncbi:MAG TPA: S9 family peptidase [Bacteroidales bacterium]|nr:S9 family peptidase [Bacteroidales bacterium]